MGMITGGASPEWDSLRDQFGHAWWLDRETGDLWEADPWGEPGRVLATLETGHRNLESATRVVRHYHETADGASDRVRDWGDDELREEGVIE